MKVKRNAKNIQKLMNLNGFGDIIRGFDGEGIR